MGVSAVYLAYVGLPVLTAVIGVGLIYWIYRLQWDRPGAKTFVLLLLVGKVWVLSLVAHIVVSDPTLQWTAAMVETSAAFGSYGLFAVFVSQYTGSGFHRHPVVQVALAVLVGGVTVLSFTNWAHGLLYQRLVPHRTPFTYYEFVYEPGFIVFIVLLAVVIGYAWSVLVKYLLSTSQRSEVQLVLLLAGGLAIAVAQVLGKTGVFPAEGLAHAAYGALPFNVLTTVALFRLRLFDIQPVARNAVVENLRDPVLVLDEDGRLVDFNEASTRVWDGLDAHVGDRFGVACPELAEAVSFPEAGEETAGRLTLQVADAERHYSVNVSQVGRGRDDRRWYSVLLRDVTALERSRWQLQTQNERLDQVASTISHDLRNPIQVADGYVEMLDDMVDADGLDAADADEATECLRKTSETHGRMEAIIDDVLTIAREGKTVESTERVALSTVARDAWANVDTGAATLTVAEDRRLQADRSKLLTIFENLLRNALDHGPDDVTVEVGAIDDGFYVADDGPGIPAEHADSVFEYGYTTTDDGTGLGLSIVETMAESHGWTVELEPPDGEAASTGTRFVFTGVGGGPVVDDRESQPTT
ncbi:His Kinase A (phospho-acceptor) domain-containing protein [Halorientalis regularis]|uniref:histidine kinase n=2 Tax=Halorientalis regularis TaxID=660518 RepID=A0A1G7J362_9EURY|nr:His Kinase A (phospho-acceptor) domain-containing protein [Halorientalis regularis]